MLSVLALLLPIGLAGAVSPVLLTEQTVLLSGPGGRRVSTAFAAGVILVLSLLVAGLVIFGRAIELPRLPHISARVDVVLGLLLLALVLYLRRPSDKAEKPRERDRSGLNNRAAFAFGMFAMATNFTTIVLMFPGAKEIASSHLDVPEQVVAAAFLVILASMPAWVPLALTSVAPDTAQRVLGAIGDGLEKHGKTATTVLIAGVGIYLIARGVARLV